MEPSDRLSIVMAVSKKQQAAAKAAIEDVLMDQFSLPKIEKWRNWVMGGRQTYRAIANHNILVTVAVFDSRQLSRGTIKMSKARLDAINAEVQAVAPSFIMVATRDTQGTFEELGIEPIPVEE